MTTLKNGWITDERGTKRHYKDDKLHNDDGPAIIYSNRSVAYYKNGSLHRDDGPALI